MQFVKIFLITDDRNKDKIIHKCSIKFSLLSICQEKSKLQKQISKLLILTETVASQKCFKSLFLLQESFVILYAYTDKGF